MFHCILNDRKFATDFVSFIMLAYYKMFLIQWGNFMFQFYTNILTDFLG